MPGLKVLGVVGRNFSFVLELATSTSVPEAFWETPVADSCAVALIEIFPYRYLKEYRCKFVFKLSVVIVTSLQPLI